MTLHCPASEYESIDKPVQAEDFLFEFEEENEIFAFFNPNNQEYHDVHYSQNIGGLPGAGSLEVRLLPDLIVNNTHAAIEERLGEAFCKRIGACAGMTMTDAGPLCPAFNSSELRKLL